jgi:hypothetical protein
MGGNSDGEAFFPEEEFSKHLGASGPETCNTYNMLKLTRHIFEWSGDAAAMDFYERALFNHILPSQDPRTGMVIYYCPLRPGGWKSYSTQDDSFWCCVGTGMENHAKYGDTIYFHDSSSLYVNLFIPSELTWKEKGLVVRQTTKFPEEEETRLTLKLDRPGRFALRVRRPSWSTGAMVSVNGQPAPQQRADPGQAFYITIDRDWKDGDRVDVKLPMRLHSEALPDNPKMIAMMYGPMVLVGDLGTEDLENVKRYGPSAPQMGRVKTPVIPAFVGSAADVTSKIEQDGRMRFRTKGLAQPHDVTLVPLYRIVDQRYNVYWNLLTPAEWNARRTETAAADARRKEVDGRTIDRVDVNAADSETTHQLASDKSSDAFFEGKRIREARGGWFSYQLKVAPDRPATIVAGYRGSEGRRRTFDVLVDGEKIATETLEYHPTEQLDREYPVPEALTRGKSAITVRFQAQGENTTAGALIDVRTIAR